MPSPGRRPRSGCIYLYLLLSVAGCVGGGLGSVETAAYVSLARAERGGEADFALWTHNVRDEASAFTVRLYEHTEGFSIHIDPQTLELAAGRTQPVVLRVGVPDDAEAGLHRILVGGLGEGDLALAAVYVNVEDLNDTRLRPGIGARVRTVGFYENGTIFYTNMEDVWDNEVLPRVRLSEDPPAFEPLKVYVGGERGERPPEPYNRSGYVPVIEGFDAALVGMRAGELKFTHIAPDEAYTRPGNEDHVLYGFALDFLIEVVSVDELPQEPSLLPGVPIGGSGR